MITDTRQIELLLEEIEFYSTPDSLPIPQLVRVEPVITGHNWSVYMGGLLPRVRTV